MWPRPTWDWFWWQFGTIYWLRSPLCFECSESRRMTSGQPNNHGIVPCLWLSPAGLCRSPQLCHHVHLLVGIRGEFHLDPRMRIVVSPWLQLAWYPLGCGKSIASFGRLSHKTVSDCLGMEGRERGDNPSKRFRYLVSFPWCTVQIPGVDIFISIPVIRFTERLGYLLRYGLSSRYRLGLFLGRLTASGRLRSRKDSYVETL